MLDCGHGGPSSSKAPVPYPWHRSLIKWPGQKKAHVFNGDLCGQMMEEWRSPVLCSIWNPGEFRHTWGRITRMTEGEKKKNEVEFSTGPDVWGNQERMRYSLSCTPGFEAEDQSTLHSSHEFIETKNMVHISYSSDITPTWQDRTFYLEKCFIRCLCPLVCDFSAWPLSNKVRQAYYAT